MKQDIRYPRALAARTLVVALISSIAFGHSSAQTMQEFADMERNAAALVETARQQVAGKSNADINTPYAFTTPDGAYVELAYMEGDIPVFRKTSNLKQSDLIHATRARLDLGVYGREVEIGLWDQGRAFAHPEFANRLKTPAQEGASGASAHATHVAGTLAASGIDVEATGLAPEAILTSFDWRFDYLEMYREAQEGLRVSNHSYSFAAGWEKVPEDGSFTWTYRTHTPEFGEYSVSTWFWDDVMWLNPEYLAVKAAGNEAGQGPDQVGIGHYHDGFTDQLFFDAHPRDCESGFACLGSLSTSKNALVVGSVAEDGLSVADFSSRGPTSDGRLKPDVVSAGTGVYSTYGPDGYRVSSGTSMAAPTVAGSVALMVDLERQLFGTRHPMRSSTVKALLIHGADDLGTPGPDYKFGWGRVDVAKTLDLMIESQRPSVLIREIEITDEVELELDAAGGELKATMAWIDPKGRNPNVVTDPSLPVLVEDVDLAIELDGIMHLPFVLDPSTPNAPATHGVNSLDNVEQVRLSTAKPGQFKLVIRRRSGGIEPLIVSLVVSGLSEGAGVATAEENPQQTREYLSVYPNPVRAGGQVRVQSGLLSPEHVVVSLFEVTGREVSSTSLGQVDRIETTLSIPVGLSAGTYFLRIEGEEINEVRQLVVAR